MIYQITWCSYIVLRSLTVSTGAISISYLVIAILDYRLSVSSNRFCRSADELLDPENIHWGSGWNCVGIVHTSRYTRYFIGAAIFDLPLILTSYSNRSTHQLVGRCSVVNSTLAFGSIGHGFESEHRLFSHHGASAFSRLRSLAKCSLDDSVRRLL